MDCDHFLFLPDFLFCPAVKAFLLSVNKIQEPNHIFPLQSDRVAFFVNLDKGEIPKENLCIGDIERRDQRITEQRLAVADHIIGIAVHVNRRHVDRAAVDRHLSFYRSNVLHRGKCRRFHQFARHRQGKDFPADALQFRCPLVVFADFAGCGDGIDQPIAAAVVRHEKLPEYVTALGLRKLEPVGQKLHFLDRVMWQGDIPCIPHFANRHLEFRFVQRYAHGVLDFHEEGFVILAERFIGIDFVGRILAALGLPSDMVFLLSIVFDNKTVLADQAIDQRLYPETPQPDFAVGDDESRLHYVAGADFGFEPLVDDFQI